MKSKEGLSSITSTKISNAASFQKSQIGKVYSIILDENTPSKEIFKSNGGWNGIGTVYYLDYEVSKNIGEVDLDKCKTASPFFPNQKYYPLIGELIMIVDLPTPITQVSQTNQTQKYYISVLNLWNNIQHNSQPTNDESLGNSFTESDNINNLLAFEGDYILEGRFGNTIRFGSTSKYYSDSNPWSKIGKNGSPITIMSNGHNFISGSLKPYTENINNDGSSIYFTSTQSIPLRTGKSGVLNPITKPINVKDYINPQLIFNADRLVLNSKRDEVMIFAKTNIELNSPGSVNINSDERFHANTPRTFLGTKSDGTLPDEPILLGNKTIEFLSTLLSDMSLFCSKLSEAVSTPMGSPLVDINLAAEELNGKIDNLNDTLIDLASKNNYTI